MISIIVPTYNREKVVTRTLESIRNQTYPEWECLVVDDKSTDNTFNVIREYIKVDGRFKLLDNNRKKGAQGARNTGILEAQGEYVVFFDSDDIMHEDFLQKVIEKINTDQADICGSFLTVVNQNDEKIDTIAWRGYGSLHTDILKGRTYFCNDSTLIRRQKLIDVNLLDEDCPAYQEWETHIRLSNISLYTTVEKELVDYYRGGEDTISKSTKRSILGHLYILNKFKKEFINKAFFFYFKLCFEAYYNIQNMRKEDIDNYNFCISYFRKTVCLVCQITIYFLFFIRTIKRYIRKDDK